MKSQKRSPGGQLWFCVPVHLFRSGFPHSRRHSPPCSSHHYYYHLHMILITWKSFYFSAVVIIFPHALVELDEVPPPVGRQSISYTTKSRLCLRHKLKAKHSLTFEHLILRPPIPFFIHSSFRSSRPIHIQPHLICIATSLCTDFGY